MKIIGLDPSAQYRNEGLNGYREDRGCWDIAWSCKQTIELYWADRCRIALSRKNQFSLQGVSNYLTREIAAMNGANCDIVVSIHTDAGGGRGVTCFKELHSYCSEDLGQELLDAFDDAGILPLRQHNPIYHYKGPTYLGILRKTTMPAVLIECGFHDHPEDIKVIGTQAGRKKVGEVLALGIGAYYGWGVPEETDEHDVSPWARAAVDWCRELGILTNYPDGKFHGKDSLTREQGAVIAQRLHNLIVK